MACGWRGCNMGNLFKNINIKEILSTISSLSTDFIDLIPGSLLIIISPFLINYPFLLLIYPQLLSFRGSISGIVVGRYSTSLHLGTMRPSLTRNTSEYYTLIFTNFILIIIGSLIVSISTFLWLLFTNSSFHISLIFIFLFIISIVYFSTLLSLPINLLIGNFSFNRGLDPDVITYPFASTIGDLAITTFFIIYTFLIFSYYRVSLLFIGVLLAFITPFLLYKRVDVDLFRREFSESVLSIIVVSLIVGITGSLFRSIESYLRNNPFIYVAYPSLLTLSGDSASIVGSKISTRLALGLKGQNLRSFYLRELSIILSGGTVILLGIILYSYVVTQILNILSILVFIAGILSISILSLVSLYTAYLTYYRGMDPDHFINPITSVTADMISTFILVLLIII